MGETVLRKMPKSTGASMVAISLSSIARRTTKMGSATIFIERPPPGTLTKHRSNGDTLYYDPATNTFAVADFEQRRASHLLPGPNSGRAYWDRQ